jgi:hypothetical protein
MTAYDRRQDVTSTISKREEVSPRCVIGVDPRQRSGMSENAQAEELGEMQND